MIISHSIGMNRNHGRNTMRIMVKNNMMKEGSGSNSMVQNLSPQGSDGSDGQFCQRKRMGSRVVSYMNDTGGCIGTSRTRTNGIGSSSSSSSRLLFEPLPNGVLIHY